MKSKTLVFTLLSAAVFAVGCNKERKYYEKTTATEKNESNTADKSQENKGKE